MKLNNNYTNNIKNADKKIIENEKNIEKGRNIKANISLILSLYPILIIAYTIYANIIEPDSGVSGWPIIIYYIPVALPIFIISLLCGMSGCKSKNKKFSNIANLGIILSFVPLLLFAYLLLISSY